MRPDLDSLWDHVSDAVTLATSRESAQRWCLQGQSILLSSGVEHVGMEGVDGVNVSPNMWEGGENVSPGEDKCISNTHRCWEVQEGDAGIGSVRGRLGACVSYWEEVLCAPPWVLETLRNGYVLPFYSEPTPYARPNQHSAQVEVEFVSKAVAELLKGGYIEKVPELPVVCSPLSEVTNGEGKKRLVVNLRHVNCSLWKQKFKYEDLRVAMMMFKQGEWMFSFDLKSGYHHVDVAKCHRKYLGFEWGGKLLHICGVTIWVVLGTLCVH